MSWLVLIFPIAWILGGLTLGWIGDRVVLKRIIDRTASADLGRKDIILGALRGAVLLWAVLVGMYAALLAAPISEEIRAAFVRFLRINLVLSLTLVFVRGATGLLKRYTTHNKGLFASTSIFVNLTRALIFLVGALIVLQGLGVAITPMLTTLGVGGIAVALALQDTLSNLFAGVYIIASKKIVIGDFIKLESGDQGVVSDINWRNTTVRTQKNNLIIVPNAKISSSSITNYALPSREVAVLVPVGVGYTSDLERVEHVTVAVAREVMHEVDGAVSEFEPVLRYTDFADASINFNVVLRCRQFTDQPLLRHMFIKRLHQRFQHEEITLFPSKARPAQPAEAA